jgi:hypothetical protein
MEDLLFDGAFGETDTFNADAIPAGTETRAFTLTVTEDGKDPRGIAVSLNITLDDTTETSIYHREGTPGNYYYVKVRDAELTSADSTNHAHSSNNNFTAFEEGTVKDLQNAFVWVDHYGLGGISNTGFVKGTTEGYSEYRLFLKKSQQIGKIGLMFNNRGGDARDSMSVELYGAGQPGLKDLRVTRSEVYSSSQTTQMLNYYSSGASGFITMVARGEKYKALVLGKNITIDVEASAADPFTQFGSTPLRNLRIETLIDIGYYSMFIMNDHSKLTGCYRDGWEASGGVIKHNVADIAGFSFFIMNGGAITGNVVPQSLVYGPASSTVINGGSLGGNVDSTGRTITATYYTY